MKAEIIHINDRDGAETISVNGHQIQFGYGDEGDGYCYAHQTFKCSENLTDEEKEAIRNAA